MSPPTGFPEADREQVAHFVGALFANASEGTASLRAFPDDKRPGSPVTPRLVSINGVGLEPLIDAAVEEATKAARSRRPMVFAPPIALFAGEKADEGSLLEGLTLSVELDERPAAALAVLRAILGPPTLVVASGGTWTDPSTGEVHEKLHVHWRLKEPSASPGEHARLKRARSLACGLVDADPTAKSAVHPMRWAGSWHRKNPAHPRLCRIVEENPAAEIALEDALAELEGLAALRGEAGGDRKPGAEPTAEDALVIACLGRLANPLPPNPDEPERGPRAHWDDWNRIGMATFRASGGSEAAFIAFDEFSARNEGKYDPAATRARWGHYRGSPPGKLGIGTLIREARLCDPGFRPRREEPPPEEPASTTTRPLIVVRAGELAEVVGKAQAALEGSRDVYRYGGVLAHIERAAKDVEKPHRHVPAGTLEVVPCTAIWLTLELAKIARFERVVRTGKEGPELGACDPPQKIAATVLEDARGWRVPVLTGTTEVPILRDDGSVRGTPGYDPETGLFLDPGGVRFPAIPTAPTRSEALAALAVLAEPIEEFPFVAEHHRSAALALILTAVRRRQLPAAPMFGVSAREAGSGKGLLVDVASVIATGRRAPATPFSPNEEEQRKFITSALTAGHSILNIDNVVAPLEGAPLCSLLTASSWTDRVLGLNRIVTLPTNVLTVANGNNLVVAGDMTRREVPIELDARCERPELRRFKRELLPWVAEQRARLVAAALTVLAAYFRAGRPVGKAFVPLGSYEAWSREIAGSLVWLDKPDPTLALEEVRQADPRRLLLGRVLTGMRALFGDGWQSVGNLIECAKTCQAEWGSDLRDALDEISAGARDDKGAKIRLGRWLEGQAGRVVGGLRLEKGQNTDAKQKLWRAGQCR